MPVRLPEWMEDYLAQRAAEGLAVASLRGFRKRLTPLARFLAQRGVRRPADITPADMDTYLTSMAARGVSWRSRRTIASTLRTLCAWWQARGLVLANPARDLPAAEPDDDELPAAPLSEADIAGLFASLPGADAADLRDRAALELLYGCGLRLSEALDLDVDDLDLEARTLHVRDGKGGKGRLLPLPRGAWGAVQDYLAVRRDLLRGPDHGALLVSARGARLAEWALRALFRRLNAERGSDAPHLYPHLLRHSIAVHLLRGGADIRHVQALLGHSSVETTRVYLRMVPGHLREAYDAAMPTIAVEGMPSAVAEDPTLRHGPVVGQVVDAGAEVDGRADQHGKHRDSEHKGDEGGAGDGHG